MPKMTLEQLRAATRLAETPPVTIRRQPPGLSDEQLAEIENALANVKSTVARIERHFASASAALSWLHRSDHVARACLVARLQCPKRKRLADY
jgi:hypothetical protein